MKKSIIYRNWKKLTTASFIEYIDAKISSITAEKRSVIDRNVYDAGVNYSRPYRKISLSIQYLNATM